MADITMPQLGETVTEGTITRWAKKVGDSVAEDEVLFEVSTDKVDSEVPSPTAGVITEILVQEGETVPVGAKLAVIGDAGSAPAPAPAAEPEAEAQPEPEPDNSAGSGSEGGSGGPAPQAMEGDSPAEVAAKAEQAGATQEQATAIATQDAPSEPEPEPEPDSDASSNGGGGDSRVLSPVVRRLIAEHNLQPDAIPGTGAGGRITRADVLAFIDKGGAAAPASAPEAPKPQPQAAPAAAAPAPAPAPKPAPAPSTVTAGERDEVVAFSNIRRRTAEHMRRSVDTSPHAVVIMEVDYENVDRVRGPQRKRFKDEEGVSLTYLPFIARAVIDAIREFPHVNASMGNDELLVHRYVNLGIAVDMDFQGLIVPVVHDADGKRLRALAREIGDLGARAKARKLGADDIVGGTFTLTNVGGYGTAMTIPIINQPQVAILSTDGVKPKPVAVPLPDGGYGIAVHPVGHLVLAFDHRAYDGAYAAAFLAKVKDILETRDWAQELA
ncbi:MAG TPA: dihydrolipoamide acetyltransferase family protein [Acidimicrobiales bacterium]|nr:dihydrolipoamide acetyltransferase family protein [Acidimicrobiales bacterium]